MTCLPQAGRGGGTRCQRDPSREQLSSDANPFGMNLAVPGFHAHARRLSVTCIYASAQQRPVDGTAPNSPRPPRKASALFSVPSRFVYAEAAGTQVLRGPTRRQVAQHRPAETELWVRTGKGPPAPCGGPAAVAHSLLQCERSGRKQRRSRARGPMRHELGPPGEGLVSAPRPAAKEGSRPTQVGGCCSQRRRPEGASLPTKTPCLG